jgi:hypothetical protein
LAGGAVDRSPRHGTVEFRFTMGVGVEPTGRGATMLGCSFLAGCANSARREMRQIGMRERA